MVLNMFGATLLCCVAVATASSTKPNFVILFADDWGWGDMGANWPAAKGMTPNLDQIAAEGIRFTDFHVGASVCSVSRAALMTGRLGVRTGVVHNFAVDSMYGLPRTENTIAELLKTAGYRTAIIGKWHLGTTPGYHPTYRGFDKYLGLPYSVDMGCTDMGGFDVGGPRICRKEQGPTDHQWQLPLPLYSSDTNCSGQDVNSCDGDIVQSPVNFTTLSDRYGDFATAFIGNVSTDPAPFFLYVPFSHIHTPQYVATRNKGRSGKTGNPGHFYDTLLELDETVGVIMAALKTTGVDDNTLVVVTGDNGPWEVKCDLTGSVGPYTGLWQKNEGGGGSSAKTTLWEGGHREVGLARWPGKITARVSNATVSSLDYLPTFLSLAGITLPSDRVYDGIDISHVLLAGSDEGHVTLFHPNSGASGVDGALDGVRWKNWKAIYQTGGAPDCKNNKGNIVRHDPPLLFDLAVDPAEQIALDTSKDPYKSVVASIAAALAAQMHSVNTTFQSVVNYTTALPSEPCVHYPKSCRSDGLTPPPTPPTPPTPPSPPTPPTPQRTPMCNSSAWFNNSIPWMKAEPKAPFSKGVDTPTPSACCQLCATPDNVKLGCQFWTYTGGVCYMKASVRMGDKREVNGATCGSIYPIVA
eukprot:m.169355 g.169355  ORF g.169355 m.169355 type:complete len:639 (-) comp31562_c0_seq1:99-2015(-)